MAALAEAFIRVRVDTGDVRKDMGKNFDGAGRAASETFSKTFTRDSTGRLRDSKGRYVKSGQDIGAGAGQAAGPAFSEKFTRDATGGLRNSKGQFVKPGQDIGGTAGEQATSTFSRLFKRGTSDTARTSGTQAGKKFSDGLNRTVKRTGAKFKGGVTSALTAAGGALGITGLAIGAGIGLAVGQGVTSAISADDANARLSAQLGLSSKESGRFGRLAGRLYSQNFGDSIGGVNDALRAVVANISGMRSASDRELRGVTASVLNLAEAFDQDLGQTTRTVGVIMRTGLAKNAKGALDLLTRGMQSGANAADDLLDTFTEYPTLFRNLGLSGQQAMGLITQGLKAGARDSDKVADALKEFSIRAVDGSKLTAQGFRMIGLDGELMAARVGKGGKTASKALDLTLDRLRGIDDPVKRSQAAVALFGTQAEDLGQALFALDPSKAVGALGKVGGAADRMGKTLNDSAGKTIESFKRKLSTGFTNLVGGAVLPALSKVTGALSGGGGGKAVGAYLKLVGSYLGPFVAGFKNALTVMRPLFGFLKDQLAGAFHDIVAGLRTATPLLKVLGAIIGGALLVAVTALVLVWRGLALVFSHVVAPILGFVGSKIIWLATHLGGLKTAAVAVGAWFAGPFAGFFKTAWAGIVTGARAVATFFTVTLPTFFTMAGRAIAAPFLWLWRTIMIPVWHGIRAAVQPFVIWFKVQRIFLLAAIKAIGVVAMWLWHKAIQPAFRGIATVARWLWRNVFVPFGRGIKLTINAVGLAGRWLWQKAIAPALRGIATVARWLWHNVFVPWGRGLKVVINAVAAAARWLWHNVMAPVFRGIRSVLSAAWGFIRDRVFTPMRNFITKTIPNAFRHGRDLIGRYWKGLQDIAKRPVNFIINTVYNKGIRGFVGKIAKWVGQKNPLPYMKPLAAGGPVPAQRAGWRNRPTAVVGEGSRSHPEVVIPTDPRYRSRALGLWEEAGMQLLAKGGRLVAFGRALQKKGWRVSEHPAFGGVHPVHTSGSYHYRRGAIDVNWAAGQSPREMAKIDQLIRSGVARAVYGLRSIYRYPGHYNHAHFDIGSGPDLGMRQGKGGGGIPGLGGLFDPLGMIKKALSGPLDSLLDKFGANPYTRLLAAVPRKLIGSMAEKAKSMLGSIFTGGGGPVGGGGAVRSIVQRTAARYGWGGGAQWNALSWLISHESSWNPRAQNPTSSAYGLFQFLNSTWRSVGGHKTSDPALQALYGLRYVKQRYGSPAGAKRFWQRHHWYERGSWDVPETGPAVVHKGEMIFPKPVADAIRKSGGGGLAARPIEIHLHADGPAGFDEHAVRRGVLTAMQTIDTLYGQGV